MRFRWRSGDFCQGQISAQGIWHLRNPNLGPDSGKRILDTRILDTRILGSNFLVLFLFQQKRPPEKFTLEKFTSQNLPSRIQRRNRAKKFTLHLCRAIWLKFCDLDILDSNHRVPQEPPEAPLDLRLEGPR